MNRFVFAYVAVIVLITSACDASRMLPLSAVPTRGDTTSASLASSTPTSVDSPTSQPAPTQPATTTPTSTPIGGFSITDFTIPNLPGMGNAGAISAGADGSIWFIDSRTEFTTPTSQSTGRVSHAVVGRITPTGTVTEFPLGVNSDPGGITAGSDGNLWFTETGSKKIAQITPSGTVTEFDVPGGHLGRSIAAGPDKNIWFTGAWVPRSNGPGSTAIGRITTNGKITLYPLPLLTDAADIVAGPDGNLWYLENWTKHVGNVDKTLDKIARITPTGMVKEFQLPGAETTLRAIAAGPDGRLWFSGLFDSFKDTRLGRISTVGTTNYIQVSDTPDHFAIGPDGNMWFTVHNAGIIGFIKQDGSIKSFPLPQNLPHQSCFPGDITSGPDGNMWYLDLVCHKIGRINIPKSNAP